MTLVSEEPLSEVPEVVVRKFEITDDNMIQVHKCTMIHGLLYEMCWLLGAECVHVTCYVAIVY